MIPEKGKTYYYFDDGKVTISRRDEVIITDVIPFNDIDEETLFEWREQIYESNHLFAKETDFFVKGTLKDVKEDLIFVRTLNNGWFSFNNYMWDGRLDIDGSINARLNVA